MNYNYPPAPIPKMTPYTPNSQCPLSPEPSEDSYQCLSLTAKKISLSNSGNNCPPKGNILHVSNICPDLNYEQIKKGLYQEFSQYGPIYEIVIKTKQSGQHFAFVDFPDVRHAEKALEESKQKAKFLHNRELIVNYCEDPRKNNDRKDQKCFLCHGSGHKAMRCPNKPELIKPKFKKQVSISRTDEETSSNGEFFKMRDRPEPRKKSPSPSQSSVSSSQNQAEPKRDKDYLRFLKMKKKILQKKLRKKERKQRRRK